ncbi:hypothetical protein GMMP15_1130049 [Candidatus Magnetomoraceae bacterium gMMP-15]
MKCFEDNMATWLEEKTMSKPPVVYETELRECMIRLEKELKNQHILMQQGFEQINKRFDRFMVWTFGLIVSIH